MKQCKKCGEKKPLTEYYNVGKTKYYLSNCKPCHKKICPGGLKHSVNKYQNKRQGIYGIFSGQSCLYIGESKQLDNRISKHKTMIRHPHNRKYSKGQEHLYINLSRHNNLEFRILEETPNHKAQERIWIDYLNPLYNTL